MRKITIGTTGITVLKNGFGALPIQRIDFDSAKEILLKAYKSGIRYFDTARAYTNSEEKIAYAFENLDRSTYYIATKTQAKNVDDFWKDLNKSLATLKTDYIDIYQFHAVHQVYKPGDKSGMYEAMLEAKQKGLIRHIGITTHRYGVAQEVIESGLYEVLMFPFSYLSSDKEIELVNMCKNKNIGFVAMKGLSGGLLTNAKAAMAFMNEYDNVLPIWGIQKIEEMKEFVSFIDNEPIMDEQMAAFIKKDKEELSGEFCRGCGYCMPCPQGIIINQCARMSQMIRRSPVDNWVTEKWKNEMAKINTCLHCYQCASKCPYELDIPNLLIKNYIDYQSFI